MTSKEISELAKECVEALMADKEFKDEKERKKAAEVEYLYAVDCVKTILKRHCIVSREKFEEVFKELEDAYNNGDNDMVEYHIENLFNVVQKGTGNEQENK